MKIQSSLKFEWFTERTGYVPASDFRAIEAVDEFDKIKGMVGFDNWTKNSAHIHVALDGDGIGRHLIRSAFVYPFAECNVGILLGITPSHNVKSTQLALSFGFQEIYRVRDGWSTGIDLITFELRRENCRFLGG